MSCPNWRDLLPAPCGRNSAETLERVALASEQYAGTLGYGISAIGELLASSALAGELSNETAARLGWLLESLGELSGGLVNVAEVANSYRIEPTEPRE